jgi:Protein of unknown function (DUF3034)
MATRVLISALLISSSGLAADGKLLGTGGFLGIQGAAGGGIAPWAVIAGYGEDTQNGAAAALNYASVDDFQLRNASVAVGFRNRFELSLAESEFSAEDFDLRTRRIGAKFKVAGDLIYGNWPQLSIGVQHTNNRSDDVLRNLSIRNHSDLDVYLSASRVWLDGPFNRNFLLNINARSTRASQDGLLGFDQARRWQAEVATALFLNRNVAIGFEYRDKSERTGATEDDWRDVFIAWFPNKRFSVAAAWVDLGRIGTASRQQGVYFNIQGTW